MKERKRIEKTFFERLSFMAILLQTSGTRQSQRQGQLDTGTNAIEIKIRVLFEKEKEMKRRRE